MISKNHRQNSNFQILHFLAGSCHTPDAAYALLLDLKEDRESAVDAYHVSKIRDTAKIIRAKRFLESPDEADRLEATAQLTEIKNNAEKAKELYVAAIAEISFINDCMNKLQEDRKYAHLSDLEACQAMQQEEWKFELIHRAENYLLTSGTIPADHFATMRMHPEFQSGILPKIIEFSDNLKTKRGLHSLLTDDPVKVIAEIQGE